MKEGNNSAKLTLNVEADRIFEYGANKHRIFDAANQMTAVVVGARC